MNYTRGGTSLKNLFANRLKSMENGELADLMRLIGRDDIISFAGGIPCPDVFPTRKLEEITNNLLTKNGENIFQYSSVEGNKPLKEDIANYLKKRGLNTNSEELIITSGSQQALDLISKIFINTGDKVIVEKPGYVGGIGAIKSYEADIISIKMEADGINITELERNLEDLYKNGEMIKFIYLVPDYSNPSGARLSLAKRKKVLKLAEKYNFYIIEDTPYSELNYYDKRLDFIKKYDSSNRVIFLGSFSKFFVPGLRIGWICAPEKLINLFSRAKQNTDLASSTIGQHILHSAFQRNLIEEQIENVLPFYKKRLETMAQALNKYFPDNTSWNKPRGGFFFWVKLPENIKSRQLLQKAIENKVAFVTGSSFFVKEENGNNYMRLSFCNDHPDDIDRGLETLGSLIQ